MGVYVNLDCLDCSKSLHMGKPARYHSGEDRITLQGMYSESDQAWVNDERCWYAMQAFLCRHRNHKLVFRRDDTPEAQNIAQEEEYDEMIKTWECGLPYP